MLCVGDVPGPSPLRRTSCLPQSPKNRRTPENAQGQNAAQASPSSALKDLARAHELHPGSFGIASAYAAELLRLKNPAAARQALQDVISAYAPPADRRAAREMLASLQASPALPNDG